MKRLRRWSDRPSVLRTFGTLPALLTLRCRIPRKTYGLRDIIENTSLAVFALLPDGRVSLWNAAAQGMFGWLEDEVIGEPLPIVPPAEAEEHRRLLGHLLRGEKLDGLIITRQKRDGSAIEVGLCAAPVRDHGDSVVGVAAIVGALTVSGQSAVAAHLFHQMSSRTLKDLPLASALASASQSLERFFGPSQAHPDLMALNPVTDRQSLQDAVAHAQRYGEGSLVFLDVDNFRMVNDTIGHIAGDQVLRELAQFLRSILRPNDQFARLSGDDFAILMEATPQAEVKASVERIRHAVAEHRFDIEGHSVRIAVSAGIARFDGVVSAKDVLVLADAALYHAKIQGSSGVVVYDSDRLPQLTALSTWVTRIKDALRDDRFILQFQPIVRLGNAQIQYFEALIRWRGDDNSIVLPSNFLSVAEQYSLMPEIDRWVIGKVVEFLRRRPTTRICVNLSAQGLKDELLLRFAQTHLREMGIAYDRIVFEITESAAIENLHELQHWMRNLRKLGCRFALDDFGVGFSSLSHLRSLPTDYVKIAGTFVRNIDTDPTNLALVQAITTMAQALGKEVIAEWVETPAVAEKLQAIGVEMGQGYYWGKPIELDRL